MAFVSGKPKLPPVQRPLQPVTPMAAPTPARVAETTSTSVGNRPAPSSEPSMLEVNRRENLRPRRQLLGQ